MVIVVDNGTGGYNTFNKRFRIPLTVCLSFCARQGFHISSCKRRTRCLIRPKNRHQSRSKQADTCGRAVLAPLMLFFSFDDRDRKRGTFASIISSTIVRAVMTGGDRSIAIFFRNEPMPQLGRTTRVRPVNL